MVALLQRVTSARVEVDGSTIGAIGPGMLVLLGIHLTDTPAEMEWVANKCAKLRIFRDEAGVMNRSILDTDQEALVVSQFTLYGNTRKGNRPSYIHSAPPEIAEPLYEAFLSRLGEILGKPVACGEFGAMMQVSLVNDGPVTLWVEKMAESQ